LDKSQIKELFFRDRAMQFNLPWTDRFTVRVSEKRLRTVVASFAATFLVFLALALIVQMRDSRSQHTETQSDFALLHADNTAHAIQARLAESAQSNKTVARLDADALKSVLQRSALADSRNFLLLDAQGTIVASQPDQKLAGQHLRQVMGSGFVTTIDVNAKDVTSVSLADGTPVFAAARSLGQFPGSLVVFQRRADVMSGWRGSVAKLAALFGSTFFALTAIAAALHWQFKRAEDADQMLGIATDRLDKALIGGECGLWDWNLSNGTIFWSQSMYSALGLVSAGEFLTYGDVAERIHPDDAHLEDHVEGLINGDADVFDREFRMRHEDGHFVWLRARAALATSADTGSVHLVGIVFDISRQKEQDKLNREAEVRLKDAIENISEAFVLWDTESKLVLCNSKYQQFHSLPASVCVPGTHYSVVTGASKEPLVNELVSEQIRGTSGARTMEAQLADGRWLQINERRTKDGGFVSVGTDITTLKKNEAELQRSKLTLMKAASDNENARQRAEEQSRKLAELAHNYLREKARAETANRAKTEFLANMSHELRTPLNAIIGFSEIMSGQMFGPLGTPKYTEYAHDIRKSGHFLLDVINDILDMSKIEAGRIELELEDLALQSIIDDVLRIIGPRANEGRINLKTNIRVARDVQVDRRALKQVMINLLANAVKFTPEGGSIEISAKSTRDTMVIEISDTGIGIPKADIEKLGRPFEQVENQFTKSKGGSGLGLAISKSLVELHNGTLLIESEEGRGTTVRVIIPIAAESNRRAA
jgi:two-component system, cell cycle sensor histidine kinase PleC